MFDHNEAGEKGGSGAEGGFLTPLDCISGNTTLIGGTGGTGGDGGDGGDGVAFWDGQVFDGEVGGAGGRGGQGGSGIEIIDEATIINHGIIRGGVGGTGGAGGNGGAGNDGLIDSAKSSDGGDGGNGGRGGNGGPGVSGDGFTLTNTGTIVGGAGGDGGMPGTGGAPGGNHASGDSGNSGLGGDGGAGVSGSEYTLINKGSVVGGAGYFGGVGVVGKADTTVINAGTISGGRSATGPRGEAVRFGDGVYGGNTLVLKQGYEFIGDVISMSGDINGGDTLVLGGDSDTAFAVSDIMDIGPGDYSATDYMGFENYRKTGDSTWTLTNSTSVVTPWIIKQGALSVSKDGNLGADAGTVTLNGGELEITGTDFHNSGHAIVFGDNGGAFRISAAGNTFTVDDELSGAGRLTKNGAGTLKLTGSNTYTDGTRINAGTLSVTKDANLGDADGDLLFDGGTLQNIQSFSTSRSIVLKTNGGTFQTDANLTLTGDILSAGGILSKGKLTKTGSGTLKLTGSNTYAGGTRINAGTLSVSRDANLGDADGNLNFDGGVLENTGKFVLQRDVKLKGDGTFRTKRKLLVDGPISGAGQLIKTGSSNLVLQGKNTYTGGTRITAGTLEGDTNSLPGDIADNAKLVFNQDSDDIYSGAISGNGSLLKKAGGMLTFTGDSGGFAGETTIAGGTLLVNNQLGGDVTVNTAGTLGGDGTIGGAVTVDGTLSAGNSPGTLTINSDLTLNNDSTSVFELGAPGVVGGNANDWVITGGDLTLDGTLQAKVASAGYYRLFDYAGGLAGKFDTEDVTSSQSGFSVDRYRVLTNIDHKVNLSVLGAGQQMQFWDGTEMTGNGIVDGGTGIWRTGDTNWTGKPGQATFNDQWRGSVAVFAGKTGGKVTVAGTQYFDTLQFKADGYTLSDGALAIDPASGSAATINVDSGVSTTIGSIIADGSGNRLTKAGVGTLVLTGANTYTGGTTIQAGTLQIDQGGTISGDVVDNGMLVFNRSNAVTFGGVISGSGSLAQAGSDTLTLTGTNTYTGGTRIQSGTLVGDASSLQGAIANNAALVFAQADNGMFAGSLSGTGTMTKKGTGELIFNGDSHTFMGATTIASGGLIVGDETHASTILGGSVAVQADGLLGGHGTIGGDVAVASGATLAPGHSIGTLTINGDLTSAPGSIYTVNVDGADNDLTHVKGQTSLNGGRVDVMAANGNYQPLTDYTILTADKGVNGQFDTVTSNLAFLDPFLDYDPHNVMLTLIRNDVDFSDVGETDNQRNVGEAIEDKNPGDTLYDDIVVLDDDSARRAFDALSGEYYASAATALLDNSRYARTAVSGRLKRSCAGDQRSEGVVTDTRYKACGGQVWLQAYGNWSQFDGNGNAATLDSDIGGFFLGADKQIASGVRLGFVAGYGHASNHVDARRSSGSDDSYRLGVYGSYNRGPFALKAGVIHAWHDLDSTRHIRFQGFADDVTAEYDARATQAFTEFGYQIRFDQTTIEPFVRGAYVHLKTDGFTEQGGAAALDAESSTNDLTTTLTGLRLSHAFAVGSDTTIHAKGMLGWRHNYGDTTADTELAFPGSDTFSVAGVPLAEDALAVKAGLGIDVGDNLTLDASYVGQFGSGVESNGVTAGLVWQF